MDPVKALFTLYFVLLIAITVSGVPAEHYVNSTEPGFLRDIGPQNDRTDNPLAAAAVAIVVSAVILYGLRRYTPQTRTTT